MVSEFKDKLGAPIKLGSPVVWTTYNIQWIGTIIKICKSRIKCQPLPGSTPYTRHIGQPIPDSVIQLDSMPKAALFMAIKGLDK